MIDLSRWQRSLPHPRDARLAVGYTYDDLRSRGGFGYATIARCEKTGRYPINRAVRALYLSILGLPAEQLPAPVCRRKKASHV